MNTTLSYWEHTTWLRDIDYAIVGSGIVGLTCALSIRKEQPKAKIVVFEKGILPSGASTKNAGFACFGSISEILDDLKSHSEEEVLNLVKNRVEGLQLLRSLIGDVGLDFQQHGGYEVFSMTDIETYENCLHQLPYINTLLKNLFLKEKDVFLAKNESFLFKNVQKQVIFSQFEGQIDTGKMMQSLLRRISEEDIMILNSTKITSFSSKKTHVSLVLNDFREISVKKVCVATNGFATQLLKEKVQPARAQVLVTKPIKNLHIKGTFHLDKGYYYFRNIHNRILLGGGRNLDFKKEETTQFGLTEVVQKTLEELLHTTILPSTPFEIDRRWSGIMGVGKQKKPIIKEVEHNVYCGVRLGGMGVAIGSAVGKSLADLAIQP